MSIVTHELPSPAATLQGDDLYRLGWRDVMVRNPDGSAKHVQVPLTLRNVLHPQLGDVILESSLHDLIRSYLKNVFKWRLRGDYQSLVLSDVGVYWDDLALKHHAPDIAVLFNVMTQKDEWTSFHVAVQMTRPALIVQIVSPNSRINDVETKLHQYHQARVPYYVILDRQKEGDPWELRGYRYAPAKYEELPKDEHGRLWLETVRVWLGVKETSVTCYDGDTGEAISDDLAIREQLIEEQVTLQTEKRRADIAEARARELEAELARLRAQSKT